MNEPRHTYKTESGPCYQGCNIEVLTEALDDLQAHAPEAYTQRTAQVHRAIRAALHGQITPTELVIWLTAIESTTEVVNRYPAINPQEVK